MSALKHKYSRWPQWLTWMALCLLSTAALAAEPSRNLAVSKTADSAHVKEQRVALVIGNSSYKSAPLKNPVNDAEDVAKALKGLGFQVTLKQNQSREGMAQAIREFGNQLKHGGTGLFYYAGHGMQVKGKNFLIPVDADIQSEDEVPYRGIDANELLAKMESARNRVNLVILDACRNNPFARSFRSSSQGLAQMDAPVGTLVAFATAPGSVAADGQGRNGLYTQHLLASMNQPGLKIEDVFKRVRAGVRKGSGDKQVPWENTSLEGDFYFKPGTAAPVTADPAAIELAFWESIKDSTNAGDYKAYLKKYPNGQFAELAERRALNPPKPATTTASIAPTPASRLESSPGMAAGNVRITTNLGVIEAELYADKAPETVSNFLNYVQAGFYNGTIFHRVIPGFMVQGGGFAPGLEQKPTGVSIKNEADNGLKNLTGTLAMARTTDPHSASTQFFINTVDNAFLDHRDKSTRGWGYAVFGKVTKGMDVVKKIESTQTRTVGPFENVPTYDVVIQKVEQIKR